MRRLDDPPSSSIGEWRSCNPSSGERNAYHAPLVGLTADQATASFPTGLREYRIPNSSTSTALYLVSIELDDSHAYAPRKCKIMSRLHNSVRDDFAYVRLDRPIPAGVLDKDRSFNRLILIARHSGNSVFSISRWPLIVNVLDPEPCEHHQWDDLSELPMGVLDWAALYPTLQEAANALKPGDAPH